LFERAEFELEVGYQLNEAKESPHSEQDERHLVVGVASLFAKELQYPEGSRSRRGFPAVHGHHLLF
jgi:hypothetical protein